MASFVSRAVVAFGRSGMPMHQDVFLVNNILRPYKTKDGFKTMRIYMDLTAEKEPLGRVEIDMLDPGKCPKTVANFFAMFAGTKADSRGVPIHYKGTNVFKMVPKFCMCGGDLVNGDGTSSRSIYVDPIFHDEKSGISHDKPGIVTTMQLCGGPDANGSQFAIMLAPAPWLDSINVPFGLVTSGLDVVERACQKYGGANGVPTKNVRIYDCGIK